VLKINGKCLVTARVFICICATTIKKSGGIALPLTPFESGEHVPPCIPLLRTFLIYFMIYFLLLPHRHLFWYQDNSVPGHLGTEHMRHFGTRYWTFRYSVLDISVLELQSQQQGSSAVLSTSKGAVQGSE